MKKLFAFSLVALLTMSMATVAFAAITYSPAPVADGVSATVTGGPTDATTTSGVGTISDFGYTENSSGVVQIPTATITSPGASNATDIATVEVTYGNGVSEVAPGKTLYYPLFTNAWVSNTNKYRIGTPVESSTNAGYNSPEVTRNVNSTTYFTGPAASGMPYLVTAADAVRSVSISTKYTLGQDLVDSIRVVYKKFDAYANITYATNTGDPVKSTSAQGAISGYAYFLAVSFKDSTSTASRDFAADITVRKTSGTEGAKSLAFNVLASSAMTVKFPTAQGTDVSDAFQVFDFAGMSDEQTFNFTKFSGAYFETDISGQSKMLIKADAKYDSAVASNYPAANINFFNGYNATFNKIGELRIPAEPGSYIYAVNANGSLSKIEAEYDDAEECFAVVTRTLGKYAISDTELDIAPAVTDIPSEAPIASEAPVVDPTPAPAPAPVDPNKTNPGTGAAA